MPPQNKCHMMDFPTDRLELECHVKEIREIRPLYGGDINEVFYLKTELGEFVLKFNRNFVPRMFAAEAAGLQLLATHGLPVPEVISSHESWLLMRYYAPGRPDWRTAGTKLAELHAKPQAYCGLNFDNFIGTLPQNNTLAHSWGHFYAQQRIYPQLQRLGCTGSNHPDHRLWTNLLEKIPTITAEPQHYSLLHGDLWSGNLYFARTGPLFIDPAVYAGDHLVDIAFSELFGSFEKNFYDAYQQVMPLGSRYRDLKKLYQLYPLLVHANLFGGSYYRSAREVATYYV